MNKERVMTIVKDIDRYMRDLGEMNITKIEELKNKKDFYSNSMLIFQIVNRSIDLAEEIVSYRKLGFPEGYRDIFTLLEKSKIIDKSLCNDFSDLIRFRNLVAHEYHRFNELDVFNTMKKMKSVDKFLHIVKKEFR